MCVSRNEKIKFLQDALRNADDTKTMTKSCFDRVQCPFSKAFQSCRQRSTTRDIRMEWKPFSNLSFNPGYKKDTVSG